MKALAYAKAHSCHVRHQSRLAHPAACKRPRPLRHSGRCHAALTSNLLELSIGVAIAGGLIYSAVPLVSGKAKARNTGTPWTACAAPLVLIAWPSKQVSASYCLPWDSRSLLAVGC